MFQSDTFFGKILFLILYRLCLSKSRKGSVVYLFLNSCITASQDPRVANSELFKGFLLSAQLESSKESSAPVTLDVFLMNGQKICLEVLTSDPSDEVLEVCLKLWLLSNYLCVFNLQNLSQKLHLAPEYVRFFSLFLIRKDEDGEITGENREIFGQCPFKNLIFAVIKKLEKYESPYISMKSLAGPHRIVLRKK
jgi:hypothetical protein